LERSFQGEIKDTVRSIREMWRIHNSLEE